VHFEELDLVDRNISRAAGLGFEHDHACSFRAHAVYVDKTLEHAIVAAPPSDQRTSRDVRRFHDSVVR